MVWHFSERSAAGFGTDLFSRGPYIPGGIFMGVPQSMESVGKSNPRC